MMNGADGSAAAVVLAIATIRFWVGSYVQVRPLRIYNTNSALLRFTA